LIGISKIDGGLGLCLNDEIPYRAVKLIDREKKYQ